MEGFSEIHYEDVPLDLVHRAVGSDSIDFNIGFIAQYAILRSRILAKLCSETLAVARSLGVVKGRLVERILDKEWEQNARFSTAKTQ
jgi:hypothetical protein